MTPLLGNPGLAEVTPAGWEGFEVFFDDPEYAGWECLIMRLGFAFLCWMGVPRKLPFPGQPSPAGLARWFDLTPFGSESVLKTLRWIVVPLAAGLYVVPHPWPQIAGLLILFIVILGVGTLINSQGAAHHHHQILCLVLLMQGAAMAWYSVDVLPGEDLPWRDVEQKAVWWSLQGIAAVYVQTGLIKLVRSKGAWLRKAKHFPLQVRKTRWMDYYNRMETPPPVISSPPAAISSAPPTARGWGARVSRALSAFEHWVLQSATRCRIMLFSGLLVELASFAMLGNRTLALVVGLTLILFHVTVSRLMRLDFLLNSLVVLVFVVNLPYWIGRALDAVVD